MITTVVCMRAPGLMFRMPIFTWVIMVTSSAVIAFPAAHGGIVQAAADRHLGAHLLFNNGESAVAAPVLVLQPPRVYIIALPFFGIVSEIFSVSASQSSVTTLVYATLSIAVVAAVWSSCHDGCASCFPSSLS